MFEQFLLTANVIWTMCTPKERGEHAMFSFLMPNRTKASSMCNSSSAKSISFLAKNRDHTALLIYNYLIFDLD